MYIGLGQGYYVTSGGEMAGVGRATPDGWQWTAANDMALMMALEDWETGRTISLAIDDDLEADELTGSSGLDAFFEGLGDVLTDVNNSETVIGA